LKKLIKCKTQNGTFDVPFCDGKTILECLEEANLPTHSHCRDGFCGACRCKLKGGDIKYLIDPLAFMDDDEFLPCCSAAESDLSIEIE